MNTGLRITTILNILANAMIQKGWFTQEEFNEAVEEGLEKMAKVGLEKLSKEQKELLETQAKLSKDDSKVAVYVIPTNEELAIIRDTYRLLNNE